MLNLKNLVSYYFIPLVVTVVAINQIALSNFGLLASSEGGGFGMFASVDTPETRFLQVETWDSNGEKIDIKLLYEGSPISENLLNRIKAKPDRSLLKALAKFLLNSEYVPIDAMKQLMIDEFRSENPQLGTFDNSMSAIEEREFYRFASKKELEEFQDEIRSLSKVKLQMWTIDFNQNSHRASTEALGDALVLKKER
jgi:hypothetical protein